MNITERFLVEMMADPEGLDSLMPEHYCEICGCSEYDACPGGCAWSERFLAEGRLICTNCELLMIVFQINMAALEIMRHGAYFREVAGAH